MKRSGITPVTPQMKNISVQKRLGNAGIKKQQGTTRIIYDTLQLSTADKTYIFFENLNSRTFPDTNLTTNQLNVGESLVIERAYLSVIAKDVNGSFVAIETAEQFPELGSGELTFEIANNVVLKQIPLQSFFSKFNKSSCFEENSVIEFDTQLVIPPLLDFTCKIRFADLGAAGDAGYLRLTFEGAGSIIAPRTTF